MHNNPRASTRADTPAHPTQALDAATLTQGERTRNAQPASAVVVWATALLLSLLALVPRAYGLADFYTIDEAFHWVGRVDAFSAAVAEGEWAGTNLTGHPGVTTMWLGSLGRIPAVAAGLSSADGAPYLAWLRLPLALVNALGVGVGYLLLRRLFAPSLALVAALLWATDPFLVAHSRVLHLDALLTTLLTLSLLALIADCMQVAHPHNSTLNSAYQSDLTAQFSIFNVQFAIFSGALWGLALVTKAPSLLLAPVAALVVFALAPARGLWPRLRWALPRLAVWGTTALVVAFVCWPVLWVQPVQAIQSVGEEIQLNGGQPHPLGNFFWGQIVDDPGPLFYPVVVALRTTPLVLLGLLLAPLALRRATANERRALLALLAFVLVFALALTREPKKFDRYLLPVFPALNILAGAGLLAAATSVVPVARCALRVRATTRSSATPPYPSSKVSVSHSTNVAEQHEQLPSQATRNAQPVTFPRRVVVPALLVTILLAFQIGTLAWYHPYYLSYYNPLFGGGPMAQRTLLVGWGEGMEQVGAWLSKQPDLNRGGVISGFPPTLQPFLPPTIPVYDLREQSLRFPLNYAVLYSSNVQRDMAGETQAIIRQSPPLYEVWQHGLLYATIHQLPRPFATPRPATFGTGLRLNGFSVQQVQSTLVVTPSWSVMVPEAGGRWLFLHLLNEAGQRVAQLDAPIDEGLFPVWQAGQQFGSPLPLALPPELPAGRYRLVLGVYDLRSGERLALREGEALPPEVAGPHALLLGELSLP